MSSLGVCLGFSLIRGNFNILIFGLVLACASHSKERCKSMNISAEYNQCGIHPDKVYDLTCLGKSKLPNKINCTWKSADHTAEKVYSVISQQGSKKPSCEKYRNMKKLHVEVKIYKDHNLTVMIVENPQSKNCTKAIFSASPKSLWQCGPPNDVFINRHSGALHLNVSWNKEDAMLISNFTVRYKHGRAFWTESKSQDQNTIMIKNLNSSLAYVVQVRCVPNEKCSQCPWSQAYTVLSELTMQPVIVKLRETNIKNMKGSRQISVTWKYSDRELHEGYFVSIGKATGEAPCETRNLPQPEILLILSSSAYQINISAYNSASISPAVSLEIPRRGDMAGVEYGKLNVTVHDNTTFTIQWKDDSRNYSCYSVEWNKKGHVGQYKSFHQNTKTEKTLTSLPEPLEPYQRYNITLHMRPDKDTCNMKHINNSESTYGSTQFYFIEGSPASAPTNIRSRNVTINSMVLEWLPIPEEEVRGFLQGYVIFYTECHTDYHETGVNAEKNLTVNPQSNSCALVGLKIGTAYQIQISGFTSAGVGVRSPPSFFNTNNKGQFSLKSIITILAVIAAVLIFGSPMIKRAKEILWPPIPNPGSSNAVQKLDGPCQQDLLEAITILKVEEWNTKSFQVLEKEDMNVPLLLPLCNTLENDGDSSEKSCSSLQVDADSRSVDRTTDVPKQSFPDMERTDPQNSEQVSKSGYTTLEMFQQQMPQSLAEQTVVSPVEESQVKDFTKVKLVIDYVRQFSSSLASDSEEMFTIL